MVILIDRLVRLWLWIDEVFLELHCGGNDGYLFAENDPVPALEPDKDISVVQFLRKQFVKCFGLVLFCPHRVFGCLLFSDYDFLFSIYRCDMLKTLNARLITSILSRILLMILPRVLNLKIHCYGPGALWVFDSHCLVFTFYWFCDKMILWGIETDFGAVAGYPFWEFFITRERKVFHRL